MDLMRETWEESTTTSESILSYVMAMKKKIARMKGACPRKPIEGKNYAGDVVRQDGSGAEFQARRQGVSAATDVDQ